MVNETVFICITPIKNEAWILPHFLEVNSIWADKIIVVDQSSTDGSVEILQNHPKVILLENTNQGYDEFHRSKLLWEAVRKIEAKKRIVIALDADEFIPPALTESMEWKSFKEMEPGTNIFMKWIQVMPGLKTYYHFGEEKSFGYVDDGKEISGGKIHNARVPVNKMVKPYHCSEVVNLHLGDVPVIRNYKKHSWYLMWEFLNKEYTPLDININYRKTVNSSNKAVKPLKKNWLPSGRFPQILDISADTVTWWDIEILNWLQEYGEAKFRRIDIWNYNWNLTGQKLGIGKVISDPRAPVDKAIMNYINLVKYKKGNSLVRGMNFLIRNFWK